eukprot:Awhi_evm1s12787
MSSFNLNMETPFDFSQFGNQFSEEMCVGNKQGFVEAQAVTKFGVDDCFSSAFLNQDYSASNDPPEAEAAFDSAEPLFGLAPTKDAAIIGSYPYISAYIGNNRANTNNHTVNPTTRGKGTWTECRGLLGTSLQSSSLQQSTKQFKPKQHPHQQPKPWRFVRDKRCRWTSAVVTQPAF